MSIHNESADAGLNLAQHETNGYVPPVTVYQDKMSDNQKESVYRRACALYEELNKEKAFLCKIYGKNSQDLLDNFNEILQYVKIEIAKKEAGGAINPKMDCFDKLSKFCGQIEKILRLMRLYNGLS